MEKENEQNPRAALATCHVPRGCWLGPAWPNPRPEPGLPDGQSTAAACAVFSVVGAARASRVCPRFSERPEARRARLASLPLPPPYSQMLQPSPEPPMASPRWHLRHLGVATDRETDARLAPRARVDRCAHLSLGPAADDLLGASLNTTPRAKSSLTLHWA